jgi:ketosteroid isomerase-like protein
VSASAAPAPSGQTELLDTERKFSDSVEKNGFATALNNFAEETVRVQRDNHFPAQGIAQSHELLKDSALSYKFVTRETFVASSGDLGYSYGDVFTTASAKYGYFVRIWRRHRDGWKVSLDMLLPRE